MEPGSSSIRRILLKLSTAIRNGKEHKGYHKNERRGICGLMCIEEEGTLTLKADDNMLMKLVVEY